jgi:hypothetical protein
MDKFCANLEQTGDLPKGADWRKTIDLKYVWEAQKALGLPKRPPSI